MFDPTSKLAPDIVIDEEARTFVGEKESARTSYKNHFDF